MEIVLVLLVALVAIDAIGRLDERRKNKPEPKKDQDASVTTSQKIIVDLSKRR